MKCLTVESFRLTVSSEEMRYLNDLFSTLKSPLLGDLGVPSWLNCAMWYYDIMVFWYYGIMALKSTYFSFTPSSGIEILSL